MAVLRVRYNSNMCAQAVLYADLAPTGLDVRVAKISGWHRGRRRGPSTLLLSWQLEHCPESNRQALSVIHPLREAVRLSHRQESFPRST